MENQTEEKPQGEYFAKKEQKVREKKIGLAKHRAKRVILIGVVILAIAGVGWALYLLAARPATALPGQFFKAQSREHIAVGVSHPAYSSNPPTGGWHYAAPAQTGIYDRELPDEQLIHNLEHGHIWISYKLELPEEQVEKLADIAKNFGSRVIMTPRAKDDSPIALAAWQYLLKLDAVDEKQIKAFINAYRNIAGPEKNIPDFGFKDFRSQK